MHTCLNNLLVCKNFKCKLLLAFKKIEINSLPFMSKVFVANSDSLNCLQATISVVSATSKTFEGKYQKRCKSREADHFENKTKCVPTLSKKVSDFLVPSRDATNQTIPGGE
jgi:hypothetical protein